MYLWLSFGNTCQKITALKEEENMIKLRDVKDTDNLSCLSFCNEMNKNPSKITPYTKKGMLGQNRGGN